MIDRFISCGIAGFLQTLLDHFAAKDVIVAESDDLKTFFRRPDRKKRRSWLDDFKLGELREMAILGDRPRHGG